MTRYRKRPVEVDAIQWTGDNEADRGRRGVDVSERWTTEELAEASADATRAMEVFGWWSTSELDRPADRVWGKGNWVYCSTCPRDTTGNPIRHSREFHT